MLRSVVLELSNLCPRVINLSILECFIAPFQREREELLVNTSEEEEAHKVRDLDEALMIRRSGAEVLSQVGLSLAHFIDEGFKRF